MYEIVDKKVSMKRVVVWNALGSIANACASFVFLAFVTQNLGAKASDEWALCFAIAALLWTIGDFSATNYFATDAKNRFSSEQYFAFKILSCAAMAITSVIYISTFVFGWAEWSLAFVLCAMKLVDAAGGYWYAAFQKAERLDVSGFSLFLQMVLTTATFIVCITITKNMLVSAVLATLCEALWVFIYNPIKQKTICPVPGPNFNWPQLGRLFLQLLPLFLAAFMSFYLGNIPKYAIEGVDSVGLQTSFGILFMPAFVINLFMIFFLRPALTPLSEYWAHQKYRRFFVVVVKLLATCVAITALVVFAGYAIGIPVLQVLYGVNLSGAETAFAYVLLGGGLVAACNIFYDLLIIVRKQFFVIVGYGVAILAGVLIADTLVQTYGLMGACLTYCFSGAVLFVAFLAIVLLCNRRQIKQALYSRSSL